MGGTLIRPRERLPERAYLEREAALAKSAMLSCLGELKRAADPSALVRAHPLAAGALIGGAAATATARWARARGHEEGPAATSIEVNGAATPADGLLNDIKHVIHRGVIGLLVTKLLSTGGDPAPEPDQPAD
jgi:hypothetical protein